MTSSTSGSEPLPAPYASMVLGERGEGLMAFGTFVTLADGETLIREGEPQDALYLVMTGNLEVSTGAGGQQLRLAVLGEGDSIGEVNLFDPSTASATVTSRGESVIWRIRRMELNALLASDPEAGIALLKSLIAQLSARIRLMNGKLVASEQKHWNPAIS